MLLVALWCGFVWVILGHMRYRGDTTRCGEVLLGVEEVLIGVKR